MIYIKAFFECQFAAAVEYKAFPNWSSDEAIEDALEKMLYDFADRFQHLLFADTEEEEQAMLDDGIILDEDYSADTYEFYRTARVTDYYEVSEDEFRKAVGANARQSNYL